MRPLLFILLLIQISYSQNVSIKLHIENSADSIPIVASKSINDDAGYFMMNTDTIITQSNKAELKFNATNSGYMHFSFSKVSPTIYLLYEPNDTIELNISKNQDNKYHVLYSGKNSGLLLMINTDTIYKYQKFSHKLRKIIFEAKNKNEILNFIKSEHKNASEKLQVLFDENKTSKSLQKITQLHLETTLTFNSKSIIEDIFRIEEEFSKTKISKIEFLELLDSLMKEYDPFDSKFKDFMSITTFDNIQAKSKFIDEMNVNKGKYDGKLWINKNAREYYNLIPLEFQEKLFAHLFVNDKLSENDLNEFKLIFPESKYTNYLKSYLKNKKTTIYKPLTFGYFINNSFEYIKQVNNFEISTIIKDNFDGKPVFVDLWASYCAPCFQEFSFSQSLFNFLKKNNIEMLYIAIDKEKDITKWQPNIKSNFLEGNHIFATDKIQESLQNLLNEPNGVYIPRYLLFNSKGKLVISNTKKPSEGQALYDEILEALK